MNGQLIRFNLSTKEFTKVAKAKELHIGTASQSVVVGDHIHIFGGTLLTQSEGIQSNTKHIIYSINDDTISVLDDPLHDILCVVGGRVFAYIHRIIRVGFAVADVFMSSPISESYANSQFSPPIKWEDKEQWRLPFILHGFGCVLYRHLLVVFGGQNCRSQLMDHIYVLDLRHGRDGQWSQVEATKCPKPSTYSACLTMDGDVHLFDGDGDHYTMSIQTICRGFVELVNEKEMLEVVQYASSASKQLVQGFLRQSVDDSFVPRDPFILCLAYFY